MRVLDRKLFRDLRRLWAQSLAVALVMACGVATLILAIGTYRSLEETRSAYYERYRFGDVFASAVRAPKALAEEIAAIDGVAVAGTGLRETFLIDIEGMREPASGVAISLPVGNDPPVNALYLREGRLPEVARANEVAVNANFADAHGFGIGSRFAGQFGAKRVMLEIVGIVLSPEYVYAIGPGDMMPDDRRFGVVWMPEETLAALYDLDGAFNTVSLLLLPGASVPAVIAALDGLLERYGGVGAVGRKDQLSNAFIEAELSQLKGMATIIPPIFLLVSAFLINMILSRLIALEREQIGLLKALGYGRLQVVWHYLKLVLMIAALGILIGSLVGTWGGRGMTVQYARFYSFPFLIFQMSPGVYVGAGAVTLLAALLGAFGAVRSAFALPAAVAMRPPAPPVYRRFLDGASSRLTLFSQLTTMGLRHLVRHPVRSALTTLGTAAAVALVAMAMGTIASLDLMIDVVFFRTDRQAASILFAAEQSDAALLPVARLPGVLVAEPFLDLPVRLSSGPFSRQVAITGRPPSADLSRVLDLALVPVPLPQSGLVLGDRLAMLLGVSAGEQVRIDFLTGARRSVDVPVAEVIQSYLGLAATMDITALARLSGTGPRISGAHLAIDPLRLDDLYAAVKDTPEVASVALQSVARVRFQETMQENVLVMIGIYLTLAVIIAFGVVYNSARIQLSERARELATLRVLGFGRGEVAKVLFVETGIIIALAQPLGWALGAALGYVVTGSLASDLFRVPFAIAPDIFAIASLVVVGAALVSALIVGRRVARLDLVRVLKTRE